MRKVKSVVFGWICREAISIHPRMLYLAWPTFACSYCAASAQTFSWKQCQGAEDWVR